MQLSTTMSAENVSYRPHCQAKGQGEVGQEVHLPPMGWGSGSRLALPASSSSGPAPAAIAPAGRYLIVVISPSPPISSAAREFRSDDVSSCSAASELGREHSLCARRGSRGRNFGRLRAKEVC